MSQQPQPSDSELEKLLATYHRHSCRTNSAWFKGQTKPFPCSCDMQDTIADLLAWHRKGVAIDVRYAPDLETAFNRFIDKWCGKYYPHLIDTDDNDGQYIRDMIASHEAELTTVKKNNYRDENGNEYTQYTISYPDGSGEFARVPKFEFVPAAELAKSRQDQVHIDFLTYNLELQNDESELIAVRDQLLAELAAQSERTK